MKLYIRFRRLTSLSLRSAVLHVFEFGVTQKTEKYEKDCKTCFLYAQQCLHVFEFGAAPKPEKFKKNCKTDDERCYETPPGRE